MSFRPLAVLIAAAVLASPAIAADKSSAAACAAVRTGAVPADKAQAANNRPATPETAATLAQLRASKNGSAAPNAEAQAMLGVLANMTASRGDGDSRAAAEALRQAAGKPGATGSDAMRAALAKLGC